MLPHDWLNVGSVGSSSHTKRLGQIPLHCRVGSKVLDVMLNIRHCVLGISDEYPSVSRHRATYAGLFLRTISNTDSIRQVRIRHIA